VATDVSGVREVIGDRETAWLASAGDADALGRRMNSLMASLQEQRDAMGARARQHVVDSFSIDAVLDRWEQFYRELLAANPKRRRWAASRPNIFTISGGA
jgi:mannosyltransferase